MTNELHRISTGHPARSSVPRDADRDTCASGWSRACFSRRWYGPIAVRTTSASTTARTPRRHAAIVDRALADWGRVIANFNYTGGGNSFNLDISTPRSAAVSWA